MLKSPLACSLLVFATLAPAASATTVSQFQPQGTVGDQTRVSVRFSTPMVRLGDSNGPEPFSIDCAGIAGEGRWVDERSWAWQMARPLQPGERCVFGLKSGLTAVNGESVGGKARFEFTGAAPRPWRLQPHPGSGIEEDQAFVINGGGPLDEASLADNLWCEADGIGQRLPARPVSGEIRKAVLDQLGRFGSAPLVVACNGRLPAGSKMKLVWGKGIRAANGTPTGKAESFIYTVREPFKATLNCEREKAGAPCSPLSAISLNFNAPFDAKLLGKFRLQTPEGPRAPIDPNASGGSREETLQSLSFAGPFPQNAALTLEIPAGLKDDAGRSLSNAASFPLKTQTGTLPPLAKFPGSFGIVELKEGGVLPVTLRNVEASLKTGRLMLPGAHRFADQRLAEDADVIAAMRALEKFEQQSRQVRIKIDGESREVHDPYYARELPFLAGRPGVSRQELPKPGGSAAFEVVGIPLGQPGYHIVEIESQLLGNALLATPKPMYVRTAVLVTNLAVHLKSGRDNALVWVTALDSGLPVAGAEVRVSDCDGTLLWQGKSDAQGRARIEQPLSRRGCRDAGFLFASARLGGDFSFARSDWNEGIEPWRFAVDTWGETGEFKIHSILDRSLFRPGQSVSMKHLARSRNSKGFSLPEAGSLPDKLVIRHRESGTEFTQPVQWDGQASAVNQWTVPVPAKLGTYEIALSGSPGGKFTRGEIASGEFRVADFRLPVFTGSVQGVPARQIAPVKVPLALGLSFINGGAAKQQPVTVSAALRPRWPVYKNFENFNFQIDFDDEALAAFKVDSGRESEHLILDKQALTLDAGGAGKLDVVLPAKPVGPSELYAEMSFADPNGEIQTLRGRVELWPAALTVGVKVADWVGGTARNRIEVVILDTSGKPLAGQQVKVSGKRRIDHSHRRRIVGGFYAYENSSEFQDIGELCAGSTDSRGLLLCEPKATAPGSVYLLAETRDGQGNIARAGTSYWVAGAGDLWFAAGNQDRIDVIPEKKSYAPGETARLQVRTPFREATALIAVEAGGIIETHIQPLSRYRPNIELPVKADWGPNVFVSVLAVRGRVEPLSWYSLLQWGWREPLAWFKEWWQPTQPTAMVDLAKPAFRLGLAEIAVGTEGFKLKVDVTADKTELRPRDTTTVKIRVTTPDGKPLPAGSEVAFAAVDQALLELRPNDSWNLLDAMLQKRGYEVETATAQSQVIGKRHFGKKALPPGGGGGRAPARELFDTLIHWQPRVVVDANGSATLKLTMNDSLSEFKLVGVATAGAALFGTGSASVRTRQDLQLISGLPPLVRESDRFTGLLTLRNGTARKMTLAVNAKNGPISLPEQKLSLPPESAGELRWQMQAGKGVTAQTWEFTAREEGGSASDTLRITQQIAPAVPVTVQQASFMRIAAPVELPVSRPAGALPDKGGLEIALSPKLATPPPGLRRFFEDYPFSCLEQQTSIAVGLHDEKRWQRIADSLPGHLDAQGLASYFPGTAGSATLTAYLLDLATLAGFSIPEDSRQRMLQGLTAYAEGRIRTQEWSPADSLLHRRLNALQALTRQGIQATRAAAALDIDPLRLPTAALIDWVQIVRRLPALPQRDQKLASTQQELRNRLSYAGSRLVFTSEREDYWWWMMLNADANAFRLIEAMLDDPAWRADLPKLMQGALERQVRGRWLTTTANAWARVVIDRFAGKFERETLAGSTTATLGAARVAVNWENPQKSATPPALPEPLRLPWPGGKDDKLTLAHQGSGQPWATVQVLAAIPDGPARSAGYHISRKVTPVQEKTPGKISRGDLWRVTLTVDADNDMSWVALTDPIPAGARIMGDGDGRDSAIATQGENNDSTGRRPSYVERSFSAYRAYYAMLPKGRFKTSYTLRLNNAGQFTLPPTRVEAMYAPDVFGEVPNGRVVVVD
ncbi:alpha-2-macroglobulin [Dechloromonas sp.]|uniref:alpha-2-macroglobulin family protein n=1 Tax=Dechloromonas sp. TaxID=1917218 RepID=UPI002173D6F7|nr:MG2 domain-containing protein [Dechloromonas sp.]MBU3695941.1 alpha-2-macroglobulin [Dechloromonas sp.]